MNRHLRWAYLGTFDYGRALDLQHRLRAEVLAGRREDTLLLLEHPPVITLGRSANRRHLLKPPDELRRRGVACVDVQRGGDVTYHGPGQLVGYPIRRVGRAIRAHVEGMATAIVSYLTDLGIRCWWSDAVPGVWTARGKIAAVGVDARGGVTMHGFALNIAPRLSDFDLIVPCGSDQPVTSVEAVTSRTPALACAAEAMAAHLAAAFGVRPLRIMAESLSAAAGARPPTEGLGDRPSPRS